MGLEDGKKYWPERCGKAQENRTKGYCNTV